MDADFGNRVVPTDQPEYAGGEGSAPTPFQLFLSSLVTCVGYYALAFCDSRGISTDGMSLEAVCSIDDDSRLYTEIRFDLRLPGGFPEKYRPAIRAAMAACSVKRHLDHPPAFETRILANENGDSH